MMALSRTVFTWHGLLCLHCGGGDLIRLILKKMLCHALLIIAMVVNVSAWAGEVDTVRPVMGLTGPSSLPEDADLTELGQQLDLIRQSVPLSTSDETLAEFRRGAIQVQEKAETLFKVLSVEIERLDDQLKVLGEAQPEEAPSIKVQRDALAQRKNSLLGNGREAKQLGQMSRELAEQIVKLRRNLFNSQVTSRANSPLTPSFWSILIRPTDEDLKRLDSLKDEAIIALQSAVIAERRWALFGVLLAAVVIWSVGRRLLEHVLTWAMIRWLPEGRLRRSTLALAIGLSSILTVMGAVSLVHWGVEGNVVLGDTLARLLDSLVTVATFCAFISGLGRALLMLPRPSWRLAAIPDEIASALGPFPAILAAALMVMATEERINTVTGTSLALTVALNGLTALSTALIFAAALLRLRYVRKTHKLKPHSGLASILPFVTCVWIVAIVLTLLTGYLSLAYFLTLKLLWISVVAGTAFILMAFFGDICEILLSPKQPSGLALANALGLSPRHQAQASTVLAGVGRTVLLLTAIMAALLPAGASPSDMLQSVGQLGETSKALGNLHIIPRDILIALVTIVAGLFAVQTLKRWLSERLLPETNMDAGMRSSLVTLVGYIGFVLLSLLVMSTLQINLTSLTWVVSALSVGIGFGLQAIVQNFISGLILLTERPVKVGDWVSLAGVEGDIRRINVRATEIQMSDRSTVIVPNSQFISQNVRNVTMGNALGVVGITITVPLDTDVIKVRELFMQSFTAHESILDTPAPSVTFKDLAREGLIIGVSGYVNSPRSVSAIRSDLLFILLARLQEMGIGLSSPQSVMLVQAENSLSSPTMP